ncbi:Arr1p [Halocaridina rubra]|uniref:Arr1p n=1 Tax=Halocaridina rubra TaxID=373956 RepID=A0AAN8WYY1_HALRR
MNIIPRCCLLFNREGCPIIPGAGLSRSFHLVPKLENNLERRGVAMDGRLKVEETNLASSTLFTNPDHREQFGVVVSYVARVKLTMGTLGGELVAEVPFTLMNPPPDDLVRPEALKNGQHENMDDSTRLVIEDCRRMSVSDVLDTQKSLDSLDTQKSMDSLDGPFPEPNPKDRMNLMADIPKGPEKKEEQKK